MQLRYLFFSLLILLQQVLLQAVVHSQSSTPLSISLESFNNKNGLSQGFVSSIIQDKTGYIWFATKDGLNRFDGYKMTVYRNSNHPFSLPDNSISQLLEDEKGNFWIGTRNKGLFLFDRMLERFYPVTLQNENRKINNPIQYLEYRQEHLMVEDYFDINIYNIQNTKAPPRLIFSYNSVPGRASSRLLSGINWMADNSIWKASEDSVFICRPDAGWKHWTFERYAFSRFEMGHQRMFACFPAAHKDCITLCGSDALVIYDTVRKAVKWKKQLNAGFNPPLDYFANAPYRIGEGKIMYFDTDGYHLFDPATFSDRLYITDPKNTKTGFGGLSHLVDRDGVLWNGSIGYGVYKYNSQSELFNSFPEDCKSFFAGDNGELLANFRTGAARLDPADKKKSPVVPTHLWNPEWQVPLLLGRNKDGDTWIQVTNGKTLRNQLICYNSRKNTLKEQSHLLQAEPDAQLLNSFAGAGNQLWLLFYCNDRSRKFIVADPVTGNITARYTIPQEKDVNRVSSFLNSVLRKEKEYWFCTNRGLLYFNETNAQWKTYYNNPIDSNSLSSDIVFSACADPADPKRYLWVGTNGAGLNKLDLLTGRCTHFLEADGLPNDVIYGILDDGMNNLWISTNQGLSCLRLQKRTFRNYTTEDGLAGNEFNRGQFLQSADGKLYFGGVDGVTWFKPAELLNALLPANNIVLSGLYIFNKAVTFGTDSSILRKPLAYTNSITLPYEKNMITLEFALLQYCSPDKKSYQYFLEGFDKNWIENGSKNTATYTNLDPGTYNFYVKGRNRDGVWNEQPAKLTITITPPWYKTWWFRMLVVSLLSGLLYIIYRYRLQQSLKLIGMRNEIASDLHDEIGSTLSSITVYSDIIHEKEEDANLRQIAGRISESSRNILVVMSDIVWTINPKNDRFDNILIRMKSSANELLSAQDKKLHFTSDAALNNIKLQMNDRKNFYLIFKEALNNAVKYSKAGNIWINISLDAQQLVFTLRDDGSGFGSSDHTNGNGLSNMQLRSRELGGSITFKTAAGKGTEINLRFPVC